MSVEGVKGPQTMKDGEPLFYDNNTLFGINFNPNF